jgi:hypothetical protein
MRLSLNATEAVIRRGQLAYLESTELLIRSDRAFPTFSVGSRR